MTKSRANLFIGTKVDSKQLVNHEQLECVVLIKDEIRSTLVINNFLGFVADSRNKAS